MKKGEGVMAAREPREVAKERQWGLDRVLTAQGKKRTPRKKKFVTNYKRKKRKEEQ